MNTTTHPRSETRPRLEEPVKPQSDRPSQERVIPTANLALVGLQLLVGYAWLLAGVDKILLRTFPDQLSELLRTTTSSGRLPGLFVALLQGLVVPNAALFGFLVEWGETLAGLGLITAGLVTLLRPFAKRALRGRSAILFAYGDRLPVILALLAAIGAGLLGLNYFMLDGMPAPWFTPGVAYGGAMSNGLFLAAASVVIIAGQLTQGDKTKPIA
ncbi:hypothetical protein [Ktedonobacter racemifer]|uniref:DoxX family protein n=1 Tax=Ktedonobacter racemifer DSM 44963 TaxID=485913 RepID=D6TCP3_KTERA|nr:hypothetical protein [Ktedonobacter racemifer]EFH88157.1 hypothetical protein Krac_9563 [Ktedonobacter racemifer DSM 44963]